MQLQLLSADKAALFGLPAQDMDAATATQILCAQGFTEAAAVAHVQQAIDAGAFARIAPETNIARTARLKPSGE